MRIPPNLIDKIPEHLIFEAMPELSEIYIKKLFKKSDEVKLRARQEVVFEDVFGVDRFGPRDTREYVSEYIEEMTKSLSDDLKEFIEPIGDTIDQTFVYVTGSMDEVANVMEQMGINLPEFSDLIPGASELILGVRLLLDIKAVKNDFEGISTNKKVNIAAAKALVTMSKFGVTITLTSLGTAAGAVGGGMIGGVGAVVGAPLGALTGSVTAGYINHKITPHAQDISYKLLNLQKEDLFYYKNKTRIDAIGSRLLQFRRNID